MCLIVQWPGHVLLGSQLAPCDCEGGTCMICEGGLALCTRCGGGEGAMPTDCPGRPMTQLQVQMVYDGHVDYDRRAGWVERDAANVRRRR